MLINNIGFHPGFNIHLIQYMMFITTFRVQSSLPFLINKERGYRQSIETNLKKKKINIQLKY